METPEKSTDEVATEQQKQDYINALRLEAEIIRAQLDREDTDDE